MIRRTMTAAAVLLLCAGAAQAADQNNPTDKTPHPAPAPRTAAPRPPAAPSSTTPRPAGGLPSRPGLQTPGGPGVDRTSRPDFSRGGQPGAQPPIGPGTGRTFQRDLGRGAAPSPQTQPGLRDTPGGDRGLDRPGRSAETPLQDHSGQRHGERRPAGGQRSDAGSSANDRDRGFRRGGASAAGADARPGAARVDRRPGPVAAGHDRSGRSDLPTRPDRRPSTQTGNSAGGHHGPAFDPTRSRQERQQIADRRRTRSNWSFRVGGRNVKVVRAGHYRYPDGWRYRVWRRGQHFPVQLFLSSWFLTSYDLYGLAPPPGGERWVRFGPDAFLIDTVTGQIEDARYGVFYEGGGDHDQPADGAELPPIDPSLPQAFLSGEVDLSAIGGSCDAFYGDGDLQDAVDQAWRDEDWNGLARLVLQGGCETDLDYYLLGLAAEGLALPDAAASYYQRALDLDDAQAPDNCDAWGQDACRSLDIPDEAAAGLERIYGGRQE